MKKEKFNILLQKVVEYCKYNCDQKCPLGSCLLDGLYDCNFDYDQPIKKQKQQLKKLIVESGHKCNQNLKFQDLLNLL